MMKMAKKPKPAPDPKELSLSTDARTVRIRADLCDMLAFLARLKKQTVLEYLDPILREEVVGRMTPYLDLYLAHQKAEADLEARIAKVMEQGE